MTTAAEPTGGSPQVARGPGGGRRQGARPRQGRRPVRIAPGWTEGPGVPWSPVVCRSELAPVRPDSHALVVARPRRADAKAGLANGWSRVVAYVALTKPRIIELLLVTTLPTMLLAEGGFPPVSLMATTLVGGTAAAGAANALNSYLDRDIDGVMHRTRRRAGVRACPRGRLGGLVRRAGEPAGDRADRAGHRDVRGRLHHGAQASDPAEHRLGRGGGLHAGADRLVGRDRLAHLGAVRPVRCRLLLDPAALLAAVHAFPQ